jgi:superfamily I DNA/RNA helicase
LPGNLQHIPLFRYGVFTLQKYVAITRARNEQHPSRPLMRASFGDRGDMMQQPSRFLVEISKELVDAWNLRLLNSYG